MPHRFLSVVALVPVLAACAATPEPVPFARFEAATRGDPCDIARAEHFEDAGLATLQRYVRRLAATYGREFGVLPRDVSVVMASGEPKPGPNGVTAAEIACGDRPAFRIGLYRDALVGRPLAATYHTVAHEFAHALQIRRDGLPCQPTDATRDGYEREAAAIADELAPACRVSFRGSAATRNLKRDPSLRSG